MLFNSAKVLLLDFGILYKIISAYRQEILTSELEREKLFRFSHIAYAYVGKTE